jgi:hypothetical protein
MITAWLRERFRPVVFVPTAFVIAAAASASAGFNLQSLAQNTIVALLLLLQFRLWDDLADRPADAVAHPTRVMVNAQSTRPFQALCLAVALVNIGIAIQSHESTLAVSTLLALNAALGLWYALRSRRSIAGDQLLLAKYPAFVVVVAGDHALAAPLTMAIGAAAIYAGASIYEAWHDPASPVATLIGGRT